MAEKGLAEALQATAGSGTTVVVAPVPELDAVFGEMAASMTGSEAAPSYLAEGTVSPGVVTQFFRAASLFFHAAPWGEASDDQPLRVDIPALKVFGACACIMGAGGESFGFLLFHSLDAYLAFVGAPPRPRAKAAPQMQFLSLSFNRRKDLPPSMVKEIKTHGWEVDGPKAYPTVLAFEGGVPRQVTERDYRILTFSALAIAPFCVLHARLFAEEEPEEVRESFPAYDGVTMIVTAPYS